MLWFYGHDTLIVWVYGTLTMCENNTTFGLVLRFSLLFCALLVLWVSENYLWIFCYLKAVFAYWPPSCFLLLASSSDLSFLILTAHASSRFVLGFFLVSRRQASPDKEFRAWNHVETRGSTARPSARNPCDTRHHSSQQRATPCRQPPHPGNIKHSSTPNQIDLRGAHSLQKLNPPLPADAHAPRLRGALSRPWLRGTLPLPSPLPPGSQKSQPQGHPIKPCIKTSH